MDQPKKLSPALAALIVIVLVGIVASVVIVINNTSQTSTSSDSFQQTTGSTEPSDAYVDGTYSATGSYLSPGGRESIELTVTLKDSIITETSLVQNATDGDAKQYQNEFATNYKKLVVGKNIDSVSLSRVAGSSLTSNGFNQAIDQIKSDAAV